MFGKIVKSLFAGSGPKTSAPAADPAVLYDGFEIIAEPRTSGGQWQVAGRIEKQDGDDRKSHVFIRADTLPSREDAVSETVRKAKVMIDQQGEAIFQ